MLPEAAADGVFCLNLFSPRACLSVLESVQNDTGWQVATVRKGERRRVVDNTARSAQILGRRSHACLFDEFEGLVKEHLVPFASQLCGARVQELDGTQLIRYGPGGQYHAHTDMSSNTFPDRYFTVLCYLNADFDGGTTSFPLVGCEIHPSSGMAVLFPSDYLHSANPVQVGMKYVFITWLCGSEPVRWI